MRHVPHSARAIAAKPIGRDRSGSETSHGTYSRQNSTSSTSAPANSALAASISPRKASWPNTVRTPRV